MIRGTLYIILLLVANTITGCTSLEYYADKSNPLLAEVGEKTLHLKEVEPLIDGAITALDSIQFINDYTESWVKQQLNNNLANKLFTDSQEDIELLVERYRNTLLKYKLQNHYSSLVDTTITKKELNDYYNQNIQQYRLSSPVVKAKVLVLPQKYPKTQSVTTTFYSTKDDAKEDLMMVVLRDNLSYYDFDGDWVYLSEVAKYVPFPKVSYDSYIANKKKDNITDSENRYLISISESRKSGDYMPMKYVETSIRKSIINSRRTELYKAMEDSLFNTELAQEKVFWMKLDSASLSKINKNEE